MGRLQAAYRYGYFFNKYAGLVELGIATICAKWAYGYFTNIDSGESIASGLWYVAGGIIFFKMANRNLRNRINIHEDKKYIKNNISSVPLEFITEVRIEDTENLEHIIRKSQKGESREWGTLLKAHAEKDIGIVTEILDYESAERSGLILAKRFNSMDMDKDKLPEYNGSHHNHPTRFSKYTAPFHYSIVLNYRAINKVNSINLLTFRNGDDVEVIAYNKNYTYIPKDKNNKSILIKANHKKILEYLRLNNKNR
ncbi:MAG: hypothetical protein ACP5OA_01005 [Candidatus Woesearchaeota archaeon]